MTTTTDHLLARAQLALDRVEELARMDSDQRLQMTVAGVNVGRLQQTYLMQAGALALVAMAEDLHRIRDDLRDAQL